ncbi:hypothetical protein PROFUN_16541, partial [Planoprotostelium fungivorum]
SPDALALLWLSQSLLIIYKYLYYRDTTLKAHPHAPISHATVWQGYYHLRCSVFHPVCIKHALGTQKLINVLQRIYKLITGSKHPAMLIAHHIHTYLNRSLYKSCSRLNIRPSLNTGCYACSPRKFSVSLSLLEAKSPEEGVQKDANPSLGIETLEGRVLKLTTQLNKVQEENYRLHIRRERAEVRTMRLLMYMFAILLVIDILLVQMIARRKTEEEE